MHRHPDKDHSSVGERDPASPFFKGFWVCKLVQVCELIAGLWLFSWFKLDFCLLDLQLSHLLKSSKNLVGFPFFKFQGYPAQLCHRSLWVRLFWWLLWPCFSSWWSCPPCLEKLSATAGPLPLGTSLPLLHFSFSVQWQQFPLCLLTYREQRSESSSNLLVSPTQIYFSQSWWKARPLAPLRVGEQVLNDKSTPAFQSS